MTAAISDREKGSKTLNLAMSGPVARHHHTITIRLRSQRTVSPTLWSPSHPTRLRPVHRTISICHPHSALPLKFPTTFFIPRPILHTTARHPELWRWHIGTTLENPAPFGHHDRCTRPPSPRRSGRSRRGRRAGDGGSWGRASRGEVRMRDAVEPTSGSQNIY